MLRNTVLEFPRALFQNECSSIHYLLLGKYLKTQFLLIPLFLVLIAKKVGHSYNKQTVRASSDPPLLMFPEQKHTPGVHCYEDIFTMDTGVHNGQENVTIIAEPILLLVHWSKASTDQKSGHRVCL